MRKLQNAVSLRAKTSLHLFATINNKNQFCFLQIRNDLVLTVTTAVTELFCSTKVCGIQVIAKQHQILKFNIQGNKGVGY